MKVEVNVCFSERGRGTWLNQDVESGASETVGRYCNDNDRTILRIIRFYIGISKYVGGYLLVQ